MLVILGIIPAVVQSYIVQPNELALERPFLEHNIRLTRQAYQLDRVEERPFGAVNDLSLAAVARNSDTLKNVRLWDWKPVLQAFRQTQEMRLYYRFYQVDVDRYLLPGEGYRQVMLSARELSEQVFQQARTWVNQYLEFTHGYGLAMCYVSETTEGHLPRMVVKDLPPESPLLKINRPAIYYGENMAGYRIVRTGVEEFDYPQGDKNVYTRYAGTGGIPLSSFWRKLLFGWQLVDANILVSNYITPESRIQLYRTVRERVSLIAPFLSLDPDPYLVVSDGKAFLDTGLLHHLLPLSLFRPVHEQAQLHPQPGQGRHRRLQRLGLLLRERSRRPDPGRLCPGLPRHLQAADGAVGRPDQPHKVPGGHIPHPDRQAHDLPHDGPEGFLQQGRRLGPAQPEARGRVRPHGPVLYADQAAGTGEAAIPAHAPDDALQEGEHGRLDSGRL